MALKSKPLDAVRSDVPLMKEPMKRVNLNVPESVRVAWKVEAAKRKTDVSTLIIEAMNTYLHTHMNE